MVKVFLRTVQCKKQKKSLLSLILGAECMWTTINVFKSCVKVVDMQCGEEWEDLKTIQTIFPSYSYWERTNFKITQGKAKQSKLFTKL